MIQRETLITQTTETQETTNKMTGTRKLLSIKILYVNRLNSPCLIGLKTKTKCSLFTKKEKKSSMSKTHRDGRTGESMYQENGNQNQAGLGVK